MRYRAFVYSETLGSDGHPHLTLTDNFIRCDVSVKSTWENDDERLGIFSTTTYELRFWRRSAEAHNIRAGVDVLINDERFHIVSTKPSGMGLRQYTLAVAQVVEDS